MLYKTNILVLFLLGSRILTAQHETSSGKTDYDYQKFKQTYDKEVASDIIRPSRTILHPASIPELLTNIPSSSSETIYAVGISDPAMDENIDKDKVIQLAILRAKILTALMVFPEVGILTDSYANEKQKNKSQEFVTRYSDFFQIKSNIPLDTNSFQIVNLDFTSFGEAIVLLRYQIPNDSTDGNFYAEANVYQNERQKQVHFDIEGKFDLSGYEKNYDSIISSTSYAVTSLNGTSEVQTNMNNELQKFTYCNYRYAADSSVKAVHSEYPVGAKLTYGIWKAFAERFLIQVSLYSQNADINIKQVGDNYNAENQTLSRELLKSRQTFQLSGITVFNNRLSLEIDSLN